MFTLLDLFLRCLLKNAVPTELNNLQIDVNETMSPAADNDKSPDEQSGIAKWFKFLTNLYVVLLNTQYAIVYITVTVL